jgi:hypothetical protein
MLDGHEGAQTLLPCLPACHGIGIALHLLQRATCHKRERAQGRCSCYVSRAPREGWSHCIAFVTEGRLPQARTGARTARWRRCERREGWGLLVTARRPPASCRVFKRKQAVRRSRRGTRPLSRARCIALHLLQRATCHKRERAQGRCSCYVSRAPREGWSHAPHGGAGVRGERGGVHRRPPDGPLLAAGS